MRSEVRGALIDAYVASYNKELFDHPLLRLNKVYDSNKAYGVVLAGPTKKVEKCVANYMSENRGWIYQHIRENSKPFTVRIAGRGGQGGGRTEEESVKEPKGSVRESVGERKWREYWGIR